MAQLKPLDRKALTDGNREGVHLSLIHIWQKPWVGRVTNCHRLNMMATVPTAMVPPYLES